MLTTRHTIDVVNQKQMKHENENKFAVFLLIAISAQKQMTKTLSLIKFP